MYNENPRIGGSICQKLAMCKISNDPDQELLHPRVETAFHHPGNMLPKYAKNDGLETGIQVDPCHRVAMQKLSKGFWGPDGGFAWEHACPLLLIVL